MSKAILTWLGGNDTGASSKAIALTAMGAMPADAKHSYPHDGADLGRCLRLIQAAPEARDGLEVLGASGGPYWAALCARWPELEAEYERAGGKVYELIQSIVRPIEGADPGHFRIGKGVSVRFGR